ncbi:MAG: hypothetical protein KKH37_08490 [Alphaproteobacteria bacterium]|nr:hypothetical protein [Alphaproteobacteria bacterium]
MLARSLRLAFWGAAVFAAVMALLPLPPDLPITVGDKTQHMLAFFTLAVLAAGAYPRASLGQIGIALCVFGAAIELAQLIPMLHRTGDLMDWIADMAAVAAALLLAGLWRKRSVGTAEDS